MTWKELGDFIQELDNETLEESVMAYSCENGEFTPADTGIIEIEEIQSERLVIMT